MVFFFQTFKKTNNIYIQSIKNRTSGLNFQFRPETSNGNNIKSTFATLTSQLGTFYQNVITLFVESTYSDV